MTRKFNKWSPSRFTAVYTKILDITDERKTSTVDWKKEQNQNEHKTGDFEGQENTLILRRGREFSFHVELESPGFTIDDSITLNLTLHDQEVGFLYNCLQGD